MLESEGNSVTKAISLWQPWATLIALLAKEFETRSWYTSYRGPIIIHAAKTQNELSVCHSEPFLSVLLANDIRYLSRDLPFGAAVCVAELVDCVKMTPNFIARQSAQERAFGLWQPDRFAWQLANVRRFNPPITMRGAQGLFNCDIPQDVQS